MLTKEDLIKRVHEDLSVSATHAKEIPTKAAVERAIGCMLDAISEALEQGETVLLATVGRLTVKTRKATKARNLVTGAPMVIPAKKVVRFTTAKTLKKKLAMSMALSTGAGALERTAASLEEAASKSPSVVAASLRKQAADLRVQAAKLADKKAKAIRSK